MLLLDFKMKNKMNIYLPFYHQDVFKIRNLIDIFLNEQYEYRIKILFLKCIYLIVTKLDYLTVSSFKISGSIFLFIYTVAVYSFL